jgi:hypothetical protein
MNHQHTTYKGFDHPFILFIRIQRQKVFGKR